jgi:hypothetical protein
MVFELCQAKGDRLFDISDPEKARSEDTKLEKFDPAATEILAVPRMVGG